MIGKELIEYGVVHTNENTKVVHISLKRDGKINPHDHVSENVFFTVVKGAVEVYLDESETYLMEPGKVLSFDGVASISAKAILDSDIFVYLIKKGE